MDNEIPIIGKAKQLDVSLEVPATFSTTLYFINHSGEGTAMDFALPPGVYPNPRWLEKLITEACRNALKTLKLSTKDLSWRKPTPTEFMKMTAGPTAAKYTFNTKWIEPYTNNMDIDVPGVEANEPTGTN